MSTPTTTTTLNKPTKHPVFWFADGSIVVVVEGRAFKVHKTLLWRHSEFFTYAYLVESDVTFDKMTEKTIPVDPSLNVRAEDVEVLLEHLYHDTPLFTETRYPRIAAILRVSSPRQLDFPSIHALAKDRLRSIASFSIPPLQFDHPEQALSLAKEYRIKLLQKAVYYHLVTSPGSSSESATGPVEELVISLGNLGDTDLPDANKAFPIAPDVQGGQQQQQQEQLSQADEERCSKLMQSLIDHFTPTVFTAPPASHMECTNALAGAWMSLVVQPAIANNGVYKPLEMLEYMKSADWAGVGICEACVEEKREEWTREQRDIWERIDGWLGFVET